MDGAFEKFSVYDFFNPLLTGGIFWLGIHVIDAQSFAHMVSKIAFSENDFVILTIYLLVSYITGIVLQEIKGKVCKCFLLKKWIKSRDDWKGYLNSFLCSEPNRESNHVIGNSVKLKSYQRMAANILESLKENVDDNNFSPDQCYYVFSYCEYANHIAGIAKKTEKMRAIKSQAQLWTISFGILTVVGFVRMIAYLATGTLWHDLETLFYAIVVFGAITALSYSRANETTRRWIKMVMATYEASLRKGESDGKANQNH